MLFGATIGAVSGVIETLNSRWAESVGDHWLVLVAMTMVVASFWVVARAFEASGGLATGPTWTIVIVMVSYAMLGIVQNIVELFSLATAQGPVGLVFLFFTVVLAAGSIVLGVRAWRRDVWPLWVSVAWIVSAVLVTVPAAPLLQSIGVPFELFHVLIFAGPFVVAVGLLTSVRDETPPARRAESPPP